MFLEFDMGNTRIKWRLRSGVTVLDRGFIYTDLGLEGLGSILEPYRNQVKSVWVASVVSEGLEKKLTAWVGHFFSLTPLFAKSESEIGVVKNAYDSSGLLGVDRWLSILAAYHLAGRACIILSMGTAATIDVVDNKGRHLGGFIAPGLRSMVEVLTSNTWRVTIAPDEIKLSDELGVSTSLAVCGGCTSMLCGLVDNAIKQFRRSADEEESFDLIFTGGDAARLLPYYPSARLINDLVLDGLAFALQGLVPQE